MHLAPKNEKALGTLLYRHLLSNHIVEPNFLSRLMTTRQLRKRGNESEIKSSFEKTLLSMNACVDVHRLLLIAEHLEAGRDYYRGISLPSGNEILRWNYQRNSSVEGHLDIAIHDLYSKNPLLLILQGLLGSGSSRILELLHYRKAIDSHDYTDQKMKMASFIGKACYAYLGLDETMLTLRRLSHIYQSKITSPADLSMDLNIIFGIGLSEANNHPRESAEHIFRKIGSCGYSKASLVGLVYTCLQHNDLIKAEEMIQDLPKNSYPYLSLSGMMEVKKKNYRPAAAHFVASFKDHSKTAVRDQFRPFSYYYYALALQDTQRGEALRILERLHERYDVMRGSSDFNNLLGRLHLAQGNHKHARYYLAKGADIFLQNW